MSKVIKKKAFIDLFEQILTGTKTFDLRLADWDCAEGDTIILIEIDSVTKQPTGRQLSRRVGFVVKTKDLDFWTPSEIEEHGYQVISLLDK